MKHVRGTALGTLLVLLVAFALLAVSAMVAAVAGLASAGQELESAHALAAAEATAARVLAHWPAAVAATPAVPTAAAWPDMPADLRAGATLRRDPPGLAQPWPSGTSLGDDGAGLVLRHYTITATGLARRGARATVEQGFTVLEPGS